MKYLGFTLLLVCGCSNRLICHEEILSANAKGHVLLIHFGSYQDNIYYKKRTEGNLDCRKWYSLVNDSSAGSKSRNEILKRVKVGNVCGYHVLTGFLVYFEDSNLVLIDSIRFEQNGRYGRIWVRLLKTGETKLVLKKENKVYFLKAAVHDNEIRVQDAVRYLH